MNTLLLNPKKYNRYYPDEHSREIMLKTIQFFETKGKRRLKADDCECVWYADFLEFQKQAKNSPLYSPLQAMVGWSVAGIPGGTASLVRSWVFTGWDTGIPGRYLSWAWSLSGRAITKH
jgi:hypothetical protein